MAVMRLRPALHLLPVLSEAEVLAAVAPVSTVKKLSAEVVGPGAHTPRKEGSEMNDTLTRRCIKCGEPAELHAQQAEPICNDHGLVGPHSYRDIAERRSGEDRRLVPRANVEGDPADRRLRARRAIDRMAPTPAEIARIGALAAGGWRMTGKDQR